MIHLRKLKTVFQLPPAASGVFQRLGSTDQKTSSRLKVERQGRQHRHPGKASLRRDSTRAGREIETDTHSKTVEGAEKLEKILLVTSAY